MPQTPNSLVLSLIIREADAAVSAVARSGLCDGYNE
jgi:hypothetical protein